MNIRRKVSATVIALGIMVTVMGSYPVSSEPVSAMNTLMVESAAAPISAPDDVNIEFAKSAVITIPAPAKPVEEAPAPAVYEITNESKDTAVAPAVPVRQIPVPAAPAPAPVAPVAAPPVIVPAPVSREVYVGLAGGQNVVDLGRGPVLFPLPYGFPPYVAEHDFAGGWARFGTLSAGMTVRMSGLVTGTYTVGQIINISKYDSTNALFAFGTMPKVMLQTCVPGTDRMIVVGLY